VKIHEIATPAILLDLDVLERNIKSHQAAIGHDKQLWPMIKTHKSTEIARMQLENGATGFLCGTLDECEALAQEFDVPIMYAYPVASEPSIFRVVELAKCCNFYIRLDSARQAELLNKAAALKHVQINYTIIINSGLDRFGVLPRELENLMEEIREYENLNFCGISTHPGHAYAVEDANGVKPVARQESEIMQSATEILHSIGLVPKMVTTGSTPTFFHVAQDKNIGIFHPGNYVFMDNMQVALGSAMVQDCALTVLATVISNPREGEYVIDAGTKCLGLDKGAHGTGKITDHGRIVNYEGEFSLYSLSEEVGKVRAVSGSLQIGDKLQIIPNHACATANNTSFYYGHRNGVFERFVPVDMRGNTKGGSMYGN